LRAGGANGEFEMGESGNTGIAPDFKLAEFEFHIVGNRRGV